MKNLLLRKRGGFDELYTPKYAVEILLQFIKPNSNILCPFDDHSSNYVKVFKKEGHNVVYSHQWDGRDFFSYTKEDVKDYDYIISNPPFSNKDDILKHLYHLNKPFAMLLPISTLEGIKRGKMFNDNGVEVIIPNKRINFMEHSGGKASYFNTSYFCRGITNKQLTFVELEK